MGLLVNIEKRLPGFKLEIDLSCGNEIIGVLGASGSGKSMLLNCIAGLIKPDKGKISLDDVAFYDSSKKVNIPPQARKTGYLFQNYAMFPHMTVAENIGFALEPQCREEKIAGLLERFHLADMGGRYPSQLSGGQQQRVALARAMAVEPKILLLDEAFSALDAHLKMHMMKEMAESLKDFDGTALFVTHNIEEAYRLCDRIVFLNNGKVEALGTKEEVFQHPQTAETARITGCKNLAAAVRTSEHSVQIPDWGISVATALPVAKQEGFLGIRANNIKLGAGPVEENCYPAWVADESEAPFRTTLFLKIGSVPNRLDDFHLQWEMSKEQRDQLRTLAPPLWIRVNKEDAFFVET